MEGTETVILGHRCNNNCLFCWDSTRVKRDSEIESQEAFNRLGVVLNKKPRAIFFTGGEPTIYAQKLLAMIKISALSKIPTIGIVTNGRMLAYKTYVDRLVEAGLNCVYFSVQGTRETHDLITRVKGSFKDLKIGVKNVLRHKDVFVRINVTCIKNNIADVPGVIKEFLKMGVKNFRIQSAVVKEDFSQRVSAHNFKIVKLRMTFPQFQSALKKIDKVVKGERISLVFEFIKPSFFEGFFKYMPSPLQPYYYFKEYKSYSSKNYFLACSAKFCNFCYLDDVCQRFRAINKDDDKKIKKNFKKVILTRKNLNELDRIVANSKRRVLVSYMEPEINCEDYAKIIPRFSLLRELLRKFQDNPKCFFQNIPLCIFSAKVDRFNTLSQDDGIVKKTFSDDLALVKYLSQTRKMKVGSCEACRYFETCEGVFVEYVRIFGFREFAPIS